MKKYKSQRSSGMEPILHEHPECRALIDRANGAVETDTEKFPDWTRCAECHPDVDRQGTTEQDHELTQLLHSEYTDESRGEVT